MKDTSTSTRPDHAGLWSTSSFGSAADTSPMELAVLGEHLRRCDSERGAWFPLMSTAQTLNRLAGLHVVTIIVLVALSGLLLSFIL